MDAGGLLHGIPVLGPRDSLKDHDRFSGGEFQDLHLSGRRHSGVEGLGDLVRLKTLQRQDGEAAASTGWTGRRIDQGRVFDVFRPVAARQSVGWPAFLLDEALTRVDLVVGIHLKHFRGSRRTTLRGLFRYAVRTRRLQVSPAESVPLPHPDSRTGKIVEVDPFALDVLLDVVTTQRELAGRYADITLVLGLTGLRFGELRGLRVRDLVDVPYPGLVVKRSVPQSRRTGAVIERATTKSGRSRLVPLTDRVRPVVECRAEGREPDDLLFPAPEGGYLHAQNWRRVGALVEDGSGSASPRPAAHGGQPLDRGRGGHQDGVRVARSLDREADARHLRPPHGN